MAGLITNAGLGILVLFKGKKEWKNATLIALFMYVFGVAVGYAVNAVQLAAGL